MFSSPYSSLDHQNLTHIDYQHFSPFRIYLNPPENTPNDSFRTANKKSSSIGLLFLFAVLRTIVLGNLGRFGDHWQRLPFCGTVIARKRRVSERLSFHLNSRPFLLIASQRSVTTSPFTL